MSAASIHDALKRVQANSPFLAGLIDRNADLMPMIHAGNFEEALATALSRNAESVGTALRKQTMRSIKPSPPPSKNACQGRPTKALPSSHWASMVGGS
jgi:hypothetical protein